MSDFRSQRIKRIRRKAILTCVFSVGTAISFSTATFAWFTINRQATLQYMNIVAQDSAMVEEVNYYGIKEVNGQSYTFDTTKNKAYLEQYDREFGDGAYQVLIQVKLKDPSAPFQVKATANKQLLPDSKKGWGNIDWANMTNYPLSTVVQMTYFGSSATVSTNTITVKKTAETVDETFVKLDADVPTYTPSLDLSQANQKGQCVYIMLDYYSAAITSIYSYNIGVEKFNEGLTFDCDFSITFIPER